MIDKPEVKIKEADVKLIEELDKITWKDYLEYGAIRISVQKGKRETIAIERTYRD